MASNKKRLPPKSKGLKKQLPKPSSSKKKKAVTGKKSPTPVKEKPNISADFDCFEQMNDLLQFYLTEVTSNSTKSKPFIFKYAPRNVSWKTQQAIAEFKTQGNTQQPMYFNYGENKKLQLQDILFETDKHKLPDVDLEMLQQMQKPLGTALKIFRLSVGYVENKKFVARTYGEFVISSLDIKELLRDTRTGLTSRATVNLELTEIASYQKDTNRDLSVPRSLVPTLPKELKEQAKAAQKSSAALSNKESNAPLKPGEKIGDININESLNFAFSLPGLSVADTIKKKGWQPGVYPKSVLDAFSLRKGTAAPEKLGSQCVVGKIGTSAILRPKGDKGFITEDRIGADSEVVAKYGFTVKDRDSGGYLSLVCSEKGHEGTYHFMRILADQSLASKRASVPVTGPSSPPTVVKPPSPLSPAKTDAVAPSVTPANKGGNTTKAVTKKVIKTKGFVENLREYDAGQFAIGAEATYYEADITNLTGKPLDFAAVNKGFREAEALGLDPRNGIVVVGQRGNKAAANYWREYDLRVQKSKSNATVLKDLAEIKKETQAIRNGGGERADKLRKALEAEQDRKFR